MSRHHTSQFITSWTQRFRPGSPTFQRLMLVLAALAIIGVVAYSAAHVILNGNRSRQDALRAQQAMDAEKRTQTALLQKKNRLQTAEGIKEEAHRKGMVSPQEEIVKFAIPESAAPVAATTPPPPAADTSMDGLVLAVMLLFALAFLAGIVLLLLRWHAYRKRRRPAGMLTPRSELRHRRRHAHESVHEP